jgi:hypothetical protein
VDIAAEAATIAEDFGDAVEAFHSSVRGAENA